MVGLLGATALWLAGMDPTAATAGPLRLKMVDGTAIEVPYYWVEGNIIRFDFPGGVVGLPRNQVASIQEVIATKSFDPEVLLEPPESSPESEQRKAIEALAVEKGAIPAPAKKLSHEESMRLLQMAQISPRVGGGSERVYASRYTVEADFVEVKEVGSDVTLLMRNILSSRNDLARSGFTLTLYDGEGNIMMRKPCDVNELDVDNKALRKLRIRGKLYSVLASAKADPKIKRYEIIADYR
jgi:hypothetical protein